MRPQFFPWLFDDKNAWEKVFADPRYSYEMPIDYFMAIYQTERKYEDSSQYALPGLPMSVMPMPTVATFAAAPAPVPSFFATAAAAPVAAAPPPEEKSKSADGILSQEEIDALLSGI
jgi:hypothetical protein